MNLANKITITRILLIPTFVVTLFYYNPKPEFLRYLPALIFIIAVATDATDGLVARLFKQKTLLGTILDPLADKLLLTSAFVCLSLIKKWPVDLRIPAWVTTTVISRDIIIILGLMIIHHIKGSIEIKPTYLGKITTFFQMITIISVLLYLPYSPLLWSAAVVFTIISGLNYVIIGSKMLNEKIA